MKQECTIKNKRFIKKYFQERSFKFKNDAVSVTLFSFAKGEEISTHASGGDAFVTCLDGVGEVTIDGEKFQLTEGQSIVMPAGHPHAVYGKEQFKMLLVVVF